MNIYFVISSRSILAVVSFFWGKFIFYQKDLSEFTHYFVSSFLFGSLTLVTMFLLTSAILSFPEYVYLNYKNRISNFQMKKYLELSAISIFTITSFILGNFILNFKFPFEGAIIETFVANTFIIIISSGFGAIVFILSFVATAAILYIPKFIYSLCSTSNHTEKNTVNVTPPAKQQGNGSALPLEGDMVDVEVQTQDNQELRWSVANFDEKTEEETNDTPPTNDTVVMIETHSEMDNEYVESV